MARQQPPPAPSSASPQYEIVPSADLPLLDLSRSVGGELLRFVYRPARTSPSSCSRKADEFGSAHARAFLAAYYLGHALAAVASVVPRSIGSPLATVALLLTLPGSLSSLLLLRWDVVVLLLRTYDLWFYSFVNTTACVGLALGLGDARASVAAILWLSNLHTCFVDANTRLVCYLVTGSMVTIALNLVVVVALSQSIVDGWSSRTVTPSGLRHGVDLDSVISNSIATMVILLTRNVLRRHWELRQQAKIGCPMLRCLNLRCRIAWKPWDKDHHAKLTASELQVHAKTYYVPPHKLDAVCAIHLPQSQMYYVRSPTLVLDAAATFYPVQLKPLHWRWWERSIYAGIGLVGLALTAAVFAVYPSPDVVQQLATAGLVCSMVFIGVTFGLLQRVGFVKIVSSFDFLFLSIQLSLGLLCGAILFDWDVRSVALASLWLWLHWVLTIDALSPLMKHKIGINTKMLVVPTLLLFLAGVVALMLELYWLNRWHLRDIVLVNLSGRFQVRLLPFFISRTSMTFLWAVRLLWRVVTSGSDATCVVMLGRIAYLYTTMKDASPGTAKAAAKTSKNKAAAPAQVAPLVMEQ